MSADIYPTSVYHSPSCEWENVVPADSEADQEREAQLTEDSLNALATQHPSPGLSPQEVVERNPGYDMQAFRVAAKCAKLIDDGGCPFFVSQQQARGWRTVAHRNESAPRHLRRIK